METTTKPDVKYLLSETTIKSMLSMAFSRGRLSYMLESISESYKTLEDFTQAQIKLIEYFKQPDNE